MTGDRRTYLLQHADPCPDLVVERGPNDRGVGWWVPEVKHRLLADYIEATWGARKKWPNRVFIDLFAGPGRVQVEGEDFTREGGSLVAWRQSGRMPEAAFTHVVVGDLAPDRTAACEARLRACGAPVIGLHGAAVDTAAKALAHVPVKGSLCLAYLDPYNLQHLSFDIIRTLAQLPRIDFAVHFSTMDLTRNIEMEFTRGRFDGTAPGWRDAIDPTKLGTKSFREALFDYWCSLVQGLGFSFAERMPLVKDDRNKPLYRLVFFSRSGFPNSMWSDVAQGNTRDLF